MSKAQTIGKLGYCSYRCEFAEVSVADRCQHGEPGARQDYARAIRNRRFTGAVKRKTPA